MKGELKPKEDSRQREEHVLRVHSRDRKETGVPGVQTDWGGMQWGWRHGHRAKSFRVLGHCTELFGIFYAKQWEATEGFETGVWHDQTHLLKSSLASVWRAYWREENGGRKPVKGISWWSMAEATGSIPVQGTKILCLTAQPKIKEGRKTTS